MSVASIPAVSTPVAPLVYSPKAAAKPAAAAPAAAPAAADSDGDHDGSVGTKIDVKA
jgi:hypothetical protein